MREELASEVPRLRPWSNWTQKRWHTCRNVAQASCRRHKPCRPVELSPHGSLLPRLAPPRAPAVAHKPVFPARVLSVTNELQDLIHVIVATARVHASARARPAARGDRNGNGPHCSDCANKARIALRWQLHHARVGHHWGDVGGVGRSRLPSARIAGFEGKACCFGVRECQRLGGSLAATQTTALVRIRHTTHELLGSQYWRRLLRHKSKVRLQRLCGREGPPHRNIFGRAA